MNTLAFSRLLARHLAVENPSRLGGDAALDVVAAMNAGLQEFYAAAPAMLKRVQISRTVRAPQLVSLTVSAQYSRTLTANVFSSSQIGCTVQIGGQDNEVAAVNSLVDEHIQTALVFSSALVFSDALPIEAPIDRLMSDIRVSGTGWHRALVRDDLLRVRRSAQHSEGQPLSYQLEERGASQDASPVQILRLWPLPSVDCIVRFEAECGPARITFSHLATPAEIAIPDRMAEDLLLPLAVAHLTESPLWANKDTVPRMLAAAGDVLARKIPMVAHDPGVPNNAVGTAEGF